MRKNETTVGPGSTIASRLASPPYILGSAMNADGKCTVVGVLEQTLAATPGRLRASHRPEVLIGEDDPAVREVIALGLGHHGFAVRLARTGTEVLQAYH